MSQSHTPPDPAFAFLRENLLAYTDVIGRLSDEEAGVSMWVEELAVETPIELSVQVQADGSLALGVAPPIYAVDVTVEPVLHRLRFTAVADGPAPAPAPTEEVAAGPEATDPQPPPAQQAGW